VDEITAVKKPGLNPELFKKLRFFLSFLLRFSFRFFFTFFFPTFYLCKKSAIADFLQR